MILSVAGEGPKTSENGGGRRKAAGGLRATLRRGCRRRRRKGRFRAPGTYLNAWDKEGKNAALGGRFLARAWVGLFPLFRLPFWRSSRCLSGSRPGTGFRTAPARWNPGHFRRPPTVPRQCGKQRAGGGRWGPRGPRPGIRFGAAGRQPGRLNERSPKAAPRRGYQPAPETSVFLCISLAVSESVRRACLHG